MKVYRKDEAGTLIMVIEVDQEIDQAIADKLSELSYINQVTILKPL